MKALLDLGLFVLSAEEWTADRTGCLKRIAALGLHDPWLRKEPVRLVWSEVFFEGFPWNQPACPPELLDLCISLMQLHDLLLGRKQLLFAADLPPPPSGAIVLRPDLAAGVFPDHLKAELRSLAVSAALSGELGVLSSPRPETSTARMEIAIDPDPAPIAAADLLRTDDEWRAFLKRHKRPDLRGRRVAVLGGSRAPFERARKTLESYGLAELRRLPPAYEETRTKQETLLRLEKMELLLVCTNRCKHTDTDHIKTDLPCPRIDLNSDSETTLTEAVLAHFR